MALDSPPSSTPPSPTMTSTVTSVTSTPSEVAFRQLVDMWHPHVYGTPPKSPTPFSIDDILKRPQSASTNPATDMAEGLKKLMPGWAHLINNFILQQQNLIQPDMAGETETGRDSIQSTPPNSSSANGEDDDQPQPLNLTKRTDPYDHEFIDAGSLHKNGKYTDFECGWL